MLRISHTVNMLHLIAFFLTMHWSRRLVLQHVTYGVSEPSFHLQVENLDVNAPE